MQIVHPGADGSTPLLVLQPFSNCDITQDPASQYLVDQMKRLGHGFVYATVVDEIITTPPVVDFKLLNANMDRLKTLINPGVKVLCVVGQNLTKLLSPTFSLEAATSRRILHYPTEFKLFGGLSLPGLGISPPQRLYTNYTEKFALDGHLAKLKMMLDGRRYGSAGKVRVLEKAEEIQRFIAHLLAKHKGYVACDTETRNLNTVNHTTLCTMQFALDDETGYVIYWNHEYNTRDREYDNRVLRPLFQKLFTSPNATLKGWVFHNAQFDLAQLRSEFGTEMTKPVFDTMLLLHMMDQNRKDGDRLAIYHDKPYSLKQCSLEMLGFHGYDSETLAARRNGVVADLPKDKLDLYAGQDGFVTFRLFIYLITWARFIGYVKQLMLFETEVHSPALTTFTVMSQNGMDLDRAHLETMRLPTSKIQEGLRAINNKMRKDPMVRAVNNQLVCEEMNAKHFWGDPPFVFSLGKPKHKTALFFHSDLGRRYPPLMNPKTKKEEYTCAKLFTSKYKGEDHLVKILSEYSEMEKLNNAYVTSLSAAYDNASILLTDYADGRAHCSYVLAGTQTGRLAAVRPNLQQIPRAETPLKKEVKNIFRVDPDGVILQADFAAAEVRMWGSLSHDKFLIDLLTQSYDMRAAYRENPLDEELEARAVLMADIHKQTAALMFNVAIEAVDKPLRSITKSIVFGLIYGRGIPSIAEQLGKSVEETEALCAKFFQQFPDGVAWLEQMKEFCMVHGYVETPFGRRRYLPFVFDEDRGRQQAALRRSINTPVQSTTGDFATLSIALLHNEIKRRRLSKHFWLVNAVHDSTLIRVPKSANALAEIAPIVRDCFTVKSREILRDKFGFWLEAPMDIDLEVSQDWCWRCCDCGNHYKAYKEKCDGHKVGPDGKPLVELVGGKEEKIPCKSIRKERVELNSGWGTLIGIAETSHGYAKAATGFSPRKMQTKTV